VLNAIYCIGGPEVQTWGQWRIQGMAGMARAMDTILTGAKKLYEKNLSLTYTFVNLYLGGPCDH